MSSVGLEARVSALRARGQGGDIALDPNYAEWQNGV